jgi:hydrogenase maturation protease
VLGTHEVLTIIGCGNPNRSDDGAGVAVVRRLMDRMGGDRRLGDRSRGARLFDAGTNGMQVMFEARGSTELVLIDACSSRSEPGSIFEVPGEVLQNVPTPGHGLHGFRWDHAIYAGKKIYGRDFPDRVTVYLIESQTLELGIGLSDPVERAVARVIDLIVERMNAGAPSGRAGEASSCVDIEYGSVEACAVKQGAAGVQT